MLEATISGQAMSAEQKKNIESEAAALQNKIQQINDEKQSYQNEVYKVDLRLVGLRNAVSWLIAFYWCWEFVTKGENSKFEEIRVTNIQIARFESYFLYWAAKEKMRYIQF